MDAETTIKKDEHNRGTKKKKKETALREGHSDAVSSRGHQVKEAN